MSTRGCVVMMVTEKKSSRWNKTTFCKINMEKCEEKLYKSDSKAYKPGNDKDYCRGEK